MMGKGSLLRARSDGSPFKILTTKNSGLPFILCKTIDSQPTRPNPDPLTHYVLVRPDLPLGVLAAQITHAAGESSPGNLPTGTYAIVLAATHEQLSDLNSRLTENGIHFKLIKESEGQWKNQIVAIGVCPQKKSVIKKYLSSFPLLR